MHPGNTPPDSKTKTGTSVYGRSNLSYNTKMHICRDYSAGDSRDTVAARYHTTAGAVTRVLRTNGHMIREDARLPPKPETQPLNSYGRPVSDAMQDEIVASFVQTRSYKETAIAVGQTQKVVRQVIKASGIIVDPRAAFVALAPKALKNIEAKLDNGEATVAESLGILKGIGGIILVQDSADIQGGGGIVFNFGLFDVSKAGELLKNLTQPKFLDQVPPPSKIVQEVPVASQLEAPTDEHGSVQTVSLDGN